MVNHRQPSFQKLSYQKHHATQTLGSLTAPTHHEGVAHLLIEGGGEERDHVREALEQGGVKVAVVTEHHEQRPQGTVHQLNVGLRVVRHELWGGGEEEGRKGIVALYIVYKYIHVCTVYGVTCKLLLHMYMYVYSSFDLQIRCTCTCTCIYEMYFIIKKNIILHTLLHIHILNLLHVTCTRV